MIKNLGQRLKFWSTIEIQVKNRDLGQKSKLRSKIEIYVKYQSIAQKSKFWSKIEILVKINYCQTFKLRSIEVKSQNFIKKFFFNFFR